MDDATLAYVLGREGGGERADLLPAVIALLKRKYPDCTAMEACFDCRATNLATCFGSRSHIGGTGGFHGVHRDVVVRCRDCGSHMTYMV